jgi:glycosyltransferase A (GT-A) superfamily protein (DUF2064 family)
MSRSPRADSAETILVLAKEPMPGRVKTRLMATFSPEEAADLAACAIEDTLAAVRSSRATRKLLVWDGDPYPWSLQFESAPQALGTLNDRLEAAFREPLDEGSGSVLLIGMDTPQVTAPLLDSDWEGADAVLGLSEDGGFWAIGLRSGDPRSIFAGIPMSTDRSGAAQLARLAAVGMSVQLLPPLRDVDLPADADHVAARYPWLTFSRRHRALLDVREEQTAERLFDEAFTGAATEVVSSVDALDLDVARWSEDADEVDLMVVSRCEPPVLDVGCGPGRMVVALNRSGRSALGVDISAVAVGTSMSRGGPALRRRISDSLPAEGRWGTALLVDSNVGMGGDLDALLRRCCDLVEPGGLVIAEVDPSQDRDEVHSVVLSSGGRRSLPLPWGRIGARTLTRVASALDLLVAEEWSAGGRVFVSLRKN